MVPYPLTSSSAYDNTQFVFIGKKWQKKLQIFSTILYMPEIENDSFKDIPKNSSTR